MRRFDDREVALILKTAAELQVADGGGSAARGGLSLAELEQIAGEAGIDPALVRRAAQRVTARPVAANNPWLGGPTTIVVERVVEGTLADDGNEAVLAAIRETSGELGEVSTIGRLFGWRGRVDGAKAEVSVSAAEHRPTVRVRLLLDEAALGSFMGIGVAGGLGGAFVSFAATLTAFGPGAFVVAGGVATAGYLLARRAFARAAAKYQARAIAIADAVAGTVAQTSAESDAPASDAPTPDR
jgi:hypothetical protein